MFSTLQRVFIMFAFNIASMDRKNMSDMVKNPFALDNDDCIYEAQYAKMTCKEIPALVPDNITTVIVTGHLGTLTNAFEGRGWKHVEKLQLYALTTRTIMDNDLKGLGGLKELSLKMPNVYKLSKHAFTVINKVTKLSLIGMDILYMETLIAALTQIGVLENLTEFVFNPGQFNNPPTLSLTEVCRQGFLDRSLILLNISNTFIVGTKNCVLKVINKVDVLNISGSTFILYGEPSAALDINILDEKPLLKVLDVSMAKSAYSLQMSHINNFGSVLIKTENVFCNSINKIESAFALSINLKHENVFLKRLYVRQNHFTKIQSNIVLNSNNSFEVLDISDNIIEYISPNFFSNVDHLTSLYLSRNRLSEMQYSSDFPKILPNFPNLEVLFIDRNNIVFVPWNMFVHNKKLEVINLADNKLSTIGFDLSPLVSLKLLDVSRNVIHFLEGNDLIRLTSFVQMKMESGNNFAIKLKGNPFRCTCDSVDFIRWVYNYSLWTKQLQQLPYKCTYEGSEITINKAAENKSNFLCKRTLIIGLSTLGAIVLCATLGGTIYLCLKLRRQRRFLQAKRCYVEDFQARQLRQKHICFFAYASRDEEVALRVLINPLGEKLNACLNANGDNIATGDIFRPGFPIYEEAFNVIQDSGVFVAVISDRFLDSIYCKWEMNEALAQEKPLILVCLDRVTEDKMSPYMLEKFRRNTRVLISKTDTGNYQLTPGVDLLAESVIELAMKDHQKQRNNNFV